MEGVWCGLDRPILRTINLGYQDWDLTFVRQAKKEKQKSRTGCG